MAGNPALTRWGQQVESGHDGHRELNRHYWGDVPEHPSASGIDYPDWINSRIDHLQQQINRPAPQYPVRQCDITRQDRAMLQITGFDPGHVDNLQGHHIVLDGSNTKLILKLQDQPSIRILYKNHQGKAAFYWKNGCLHLPGVSLTDSQLHGLKNMPIGALFSSSPISHLKIMQASRRHSMTIAKIGDCDER